MTVTGKSAIRVDAVSVLARIALALVNVFASSSIARELISRIANATEPSVPVDALTVLTHSVVGALVLVQAEPAVGRVGKAALALANVGPGRVPASSAETNSGIFHALVHIDTAESGRRNRESFFAFTAERSPIVDADSICAKAGGFALIIINAITAIPSNKLKYIFLFKTSAEARKPLESFL